MAVGDFLIGLGSNATARGECALPCTRNQFHKASIATTTAIAARS